jgi:hypothetical protein
MPFPLDPRFLRAAEHKLGRALPLSYSSRMCRSNGGDVAAGGDSFLLHPILDTTDRKRLARTCNDILRETASARDRPGFPPEALAIGDNGGGDLLVLLPDPEAPRFADPVFWWDHETGELTRVADALDLLT